MLILGWMESMGGYRFSCLWTTPLSYVPLERGRRKMSTLLHEWCTNNEVKVNTENSKIISYQCH